MDVVVVQSEGAVQFLTLAPSLLAWNVMEQLVLLHVFVRANVADYSAVGIIMRHLLYGAIAVHDHAIVTHVMNVVMPAVDSVIIE